MKSSVGLLGEIRRAAAGMAVSSIGSPIRAWFG
jgi:hypothetical protein